MSLKVLINGNIDNSNIIKLLQNWYPNLKVIEYKENQEIEKCDLALFSGGEDVNPKYYRQSQNTKTRYNTKRDKFEYNMFNYARHSKTPCLGICRGSQFLTVMNGGKLFQHVNNHDKDHFISVNKKYVTFKKQVKEESLTIQQRQQIALENFRERFQNNNSTDLFEENNLVEINVTSTHHQMMNPYILHKDQYEIIGFSTYHQSDVYEEVYPVSLRDKIYENFVEPEIVFYKNTKSLAIQGHPEFNNATDEFKNLTLDLINKLLLK